MISRNCPCCGRAFVAYYLGHDQLTTDDVFICSGCQMLLVYENGELRSLSDAEAREKLYRMLKRWTKI